jgi:two-component system cell cycle response regulator
MGFEVNNINPIEENTRNFKTRLRVLWVDDDATIRENGREMIELLGHKCDTAINGNIALNCLEQNTYDIVITDIVMPELNGWELVAAIRAKRADRIKIIVISAWDIDASAKHQYKVDFVLQKPFKMERINEIINK